MCNLFLINGHDLNWWHTLISWSVITVSMGSTNKNLTDQNIDKPSFDLQQSRLTYSRAERWLTDEVCHVTDHWAWTQWTVPSVDRFLIKSMTGRSDMWTFVVVVDSSFVLECLWGKPKINMVNQEFQIEDRLSLPLWRRENPHNTAIFTQLSYLPSIQILLLSHCTKIWV